MNQSPDCECCFCKRQRFLKDQDRRRAEILSRRDMEAAAQAGAEPQKDAP